MSNSIGNNLLHQSLLPSTILEPQSIINSPCIGGNTLLSPQATSVARKSSLSTEFRGCKLILQKKKFPMGKQRAVSVFQWMKKKKSCLITHLTPLIIDPHFRQEILSNIARAGNAIEELYGSPQDIEGVVREGKIYAVQTRPQM